MGLSSDTFDQVMFSVLNFSIENLMNFATSIQQHVTCPFLAGISSWAR